MTQQGCLQDYYYQDPNYMNPYLPKNQTWVLAREPGYASRAETLRVTLDQNQGWFLLPKMHNGTLLDKTRVQKNLGNTGKTLPALLADPKSLETVRNHLAQNACNTCMLTLNYDPLDRKAGEHLGAKCTSGKTITMLILPWDKVHPTKPEALVGMMKKFDEGQAEFTIWPLADLTTDPPVPVKPEVQAKAKKQFAKRPCSYRAQYRPRGGPSKPRGITMESFFKPNK